MKTHTLRAAALLISFLPLASLHADSTLLEIGAFDGQNGDFEQESDAYNNPTWYSEPGDYSETQGSYGFGAAWEGPGAEILQDGPAGGLIDPNDPESGNIWSLTQDGFPRALVPGRPVLDIFFQMTSEEAAAPALLLETKLFGLGENSYHDVTFYLNNVPFYRKLGIRGDTDLKLPVYKNVPGMVFNAGPNVLSARRTGGGKVDAAGGDNPWIQFDAIKLSTQTAPSTELIWQVGDFNNATAEFEQERDDFNNPQFYVEAGDFSSVAGQAAKGGVFGGAVGEIWKDADSPGETSPDGFPRALVPGRPTIDLFFDLTAAQAAKDYLLFKTVLFAQGGNSSHDVRVYLNGVPVSIGFGIQKDTDVEVLIPKLGVRGAGAGPAFNAGKNVLSFVRTGGGPVVPVSEGGADEPWIQIDAVSLSTAEAPANPEDPEAYKNLFAIGYFNGNSNEFEQESGAYNGPTFYAAAGDYTAVTGKTGVGEVWAEAPEIWQDGPDGTFIEPGNPASGHIWSLTQNGFPRALIKQDWGRPIIDIFFQASAGDLAGRCLFTTKLWGLGPDSSHDLEFSLNGTTFWSQAAVNKDTYVNALIPPGALLAGGNVLSLVRTGGLNTDTAWIQFDQVELITEAVGAVVPPAADFDIATVTRSANGAVTLTWESEAAGRYTVQSSDSLTGAWTNVAADLPGAAGATTSYSDAPPAAGVTRLFYRVVRTQ